MNIGIFLIFGCEMAENCQKLILVRILGVDVCHCSEGDFGGGRGAFLPRQAVKDCGVGDEAWIGLKARSLNNQ